MVPSIERPGAETGCEEVVKMFGRRNVRVAVKIM
jgi:hypothetical protein